YEMLTGRPPLEGETIGEIMKRIQRDEPPTPHVIAADVPMELSTICSKCLAKEPDDRYASAGVLADDLQRFLRGEAILAQPVDWCERFTRWRRQPVRLAV